MINQGFSRELRLLTPEHYKHVFKQPRRARSSHFTILAKNNSLSHPRLGLAIAKKNIKLAVSRNRIKRVIRESFRLNQNMLPKQDFVIMANKNADLLSNEELFKQLNQLWIRLKKQSQKS